MSVEPEAGRWCAPPESPTWSWTRCSAELAAARVELGYHGDLDWAGVALAERAVARHGVRPWRMGVDDYVAGLASGGPALTGVPMDPSWDPELGAAMRRHGRAVHEEAMLGDLLDALGP